VATTVVPVEPIAEALTGYFGSLAAWSQPTSGVVVGGAAALYAQHRAVAQAIVGGVPAGGTAQQTAIGYQVCVDAATCTQYTDLEIDPSSGLLRSFSVDGVPIAIRVSGRGEPVTVEGITAVVASAVESTAGELSVIVEVSNDRAGGVRVFPFAAVYAGAGGLTAVDAVGAWGPAQLAPTETGPFLLTFPTSMPGGVVSFTALTDEGFDIALDVGVPAP
jgi:hypothetical protein